MRQTRPIVARHHGWRACLCAILLLVAARATGGAQEQGPRPPFRTETTLVIVDTVVLDDRDRPVEGLRADDFEVLDEGTPRRVEFFQPATSVSGGVPGATRAHRFPYSTNVGAAAAATRTFVLLFDDLHLTREQGERAKQALARFIETELVDGDLVSLVVPGVALRWHARLPQGRETLLAIARGLQGRLQPEPTFERITDYEAYRIHVFQDEAVASQVDRRWKSHRVLGREAGNLATDRGFQPQERGGAAGVITPDLAIRAAAVYSRMMARDRVTLGSLRTMIEGLEGVRGRKSVLLLSAGLVEDQEQVDARHVRDAARRANVAVYFIDARGLEAGSAFGSAQAGGPIDSRDIGFANAQIELEVQGAENLAVDTGGFSVRNANDVTAALGRIARELSSYYLLGFQPAERGRAGAYRRIEVRVNRPGVHVRARKGYHVGGGTSAGAKNPATMGTDALQRVTDSPYDVDTIPLRASTHVFGDAGAGRAVVLLALEADLRAFAFAPQGDKTRDVLELRIAATHLETATAERYDGEVEMTFPAAVRFGEDSWHGIVREFRLAPGQYQARVAVRDRNSGRVGAVTHAFVVPALEGFRVTTPIVTDTVQTPADGAQGAPRPVLVVRREFPAGATVYYQFGVLGATAGGRVIADHEVRDPSGAVVKQLAARPIAPAPDGALVRLAPLSMRGLPAGDYELLLRVTDEASGRTVHLREPFALLPPAGRP